MHVQMHTPPAPGTFGRVLRRTDRHLGLAVNTIVHCYTATVRARAVTHPDGVDAIALFFPVKEGNEAAADRQIKFGWVDVTEMWAPYRDRPAIPEGGLSEMAWNDLVSLAGTYDIPTHGRKRELVESDVAEVIGAA